MTTSSEWADCLRLDIIHLMPCDGLATLQLQQRLNPLPSFEGFLDTYEREVLPPRELAKGPLGLYAVHFRRFQRHVEGKAVDQITIRMIARKFRT